MMDQLGWDVVKNDGIDHYVGIKLKHSTSISETSIENEGSTMNRETNIVGTMTYMVPAIRLRVSSSMAEPQLMTQVTNGCFGL